MDGNDALADSAGNNLFVGGSGNDTLTDATGNSLLLGGKGNDTLVTGSGRDILAFNKGDGRDTVVSGAGRDNTVSLGGGIRYADLALRKSGNDLVLDTSNADSITFKDWYQGSNHHDILKLQVITEAMTGYSPASTNPLYNKKVETFDFAKLVQGFDLARAKNWAMNHWTVMDKLLDAHLAGSDTEALGGDLAYQYGKNGTLAGLALTPVQGILSSAQFGTGAQTLQPIAGLQEGLVKLG